MLIAKYRLSSIAKIEIFRWGCYVHPGTTLRQRMNINLKHPTMFKQTEEKHRKAMFTTFQCGAILKKNRTKIVYLFDVMGHNCFYQIEKIDQCAPKIVHEQKWSDLFLSRRNSK